MLAATLLLLGAAPATRPTTGALVVRICRVDARSTLSSAEVTVEAGVPFSTHTRIGNATLNIDGTLNNIHGDTRRLFLRYEEFTIDPRTGGLNKRMISTRVELEQRRDQYEMGRWGDERLTVTLAPAPQS